MGLSIGGIGKLIGGFIGGPAGMAIGIGSGLLDGGGGGAAGGGRSGGQDPRMAFLQLSEDSSIKGQQNLKDVQTRNSDAAVTANNILQSYLQEIPKDRRRAVQEKLYNTSMNG
jgi:hypothetical protein